MEVILHFYTEEEVTPRIFAQKIALACARSGAIRVGERVCAGNYVYEYTGDVVLKPGVVGTNPLTVPNVEQVHP